MADNGAKKGLPKRAGRRAELASKRAGQHVEQRQRRDRRVKAQREREVQNRSEVARSAAPTFVTAGKRPSKAARAARRYQARQG